MFPDDIKFCPYCGHQTLYEADTVRCHGCGADFAVLEPEDIKDLREKIKAFENLQDAVNDFLQERITQEELEKIFETTL